MFFRFFTNIFRKVNGEDVDVNIENGLQEIPEMGDFTGDGDVSGLDSYQISRLAVGMDTDVDGFEGMKPSMLANFNKIYLIKK